MRKRNKKFFGISLCRSILLFAEVASQLELKMSKLEIDATPKHCDLSAIEQYYEKHVAKLNSPTPSSRTVSSTYSVKDSSRLDIDSVGESSTAPNSDVEELELDSVIANDRFLQNDLLQSTTEAGNVIVVKNVDSAARIDSIAIQNSSDIQIGNKTFYNGSVVIKQFLLDDKLNKWRSRTSNEANGNENGVLNNGFSGKALIIDASSVINRFHLHESRFGISFSENL